MRLIDAHSWFPRSRKKFSGYLTCAHAQAHNPSTPQGHTPAAGLPILQLTKEAGAGATTHPRCLLAATVVPLICPHQVACFAAISRCCCQRAAMQDTLPADALHTAPALQLQCSPQSCPPLTSALLDPTLAADALHAALTQQLRKFALQSWYPPITRKVHSRCPHAPCCVSCPAAAQSPLLLQPLHRLLS